MPEPKKDEHLDTGGANVEVNAQAFFDPNVPDPVLDEDGKEVKSRSDIDQGQAAVLDPQAQRELEAATKKAAKERLDKEKKAKEEADKLVTESSVKATAQAPGQGQKAPK